MSQGETLRPVTSTVAAAEIVRRVASLYDLGSGLDGYLMRRGFNDVYKLTTDDGRRYVARLSGARGRGGPNTDYETALLAHLKRRGVAVSGPIPARDGRLWRELPAAEGPRDLVVFDFLDGSPPMLDLGDVGLMGAELAAVHAAAETYAGPPSRYRLDVDYLVRRPTALILVAPTIDDELGGKIARRADAVAARLEAFEGLSEVACHGDCHGFNTLMITDAEGRRRGGFFDFDDGGPGPLAFDLGVYLWNILQRLGSKPFEDQHRVVWRAFLDGYGGTRPIPLADLDAIPAYLQARELWFLGEYAAHMDQWGAESFAVPWVRARLGALRSWDQACAFAMG